MIEKASKGGRENLVRIFVSLRNGYGLDKVITRFNATAKGPEEKLHAAISSQTSGYIKKVLLSILDQEFTPTPSEAKDEAVAMADQIQKAIKGWGTDEDALIRELAGNTRSQVAKARAMFDKKFDKPIVKAIEEDTSGKLENALVGLVMTRPEFDAKLIYDACKGWGTDEAVVSEVLCSRSRAEIEAISGAFKVAYKKDMLEVIHGETSGKLQTVYTMLVTGKRPAFPGLPKSEEAKEDAAPPAAFERNLSVDVERLYNAGAGKWGTDEEEFIYSLTTATLEYREALYKGYRAKYHDSLTTDIFSQMSGDFAVALAHLATPPHLLYETKLRLALKGHVEDLKKKAEDLKKKAEAPLLQGNA